MTRKRSPPRVVPAAPPAQQVVDTRSDFDRWRERVDALEDEWDAAAAEYDAATDAWNEAYEAATAAYERFQLA